MWRRDRFHFLWIWFSITTSWHARSGPAVQRLGPMDTAHNIKQNLEYPSCPVEWNGFITVWRHDPFDRS
jgi:hypothetical protein